MSSTALMHAAERFGDRRKIAAAHHLGADPLGQSGQLLKRLRDRAAERAERQALGERIDGINPREL
ncbi:hypothetical protein ABIF75_010847 [Bradyrhizobium japonicum]